MLEYYDREGRLITQDQWFGYMEGESYKRVALTETKGWYISTVWLGLSHQFGEGPPLIFETMVFTDDSAKADDLLCARYSTEEEAKQGHEVVVNYMTSGDYIKDVIDEALQSYDDKHREGLRDQNDV